MKLSRLLGATALAGSLLCLPAVAWAQDTTATTAQSEDEAADDEATGEEDAPIVVTGSRIARPTLESSVPVTSMSVGELTERGNVTLGDALNDLPSLRSTFSTSNSGRFIGTAGLSVLDLRGLGTARTLVLVNGRRHITASPGDYLVDVNTIPIDLLERVDVVTGGNSAIYGSDAVAGVVNFILKRDFDGISLRGQGGISQRGDRGSYFISGAWGTNFADGRGNIAISAEYAKQEPLYYRSRDDQFGAYSGRCQFNLAEPTAGEPAAGDGIPDNQFFCGIKNNSLSTGSTVGTLTVGGVAAAQALRFDDGGNLYFDTADGINFGPFGSGNWQGGEGTTLREVGQLSVGVQRYTANLLAHFDVSDAFKPFIEAKYVHVDAIQEGQASFYQGNLTTFFGGNFGVPVPALRCDNPFLGAGNIATLRSVGLCNYGATQPNPLFGQPGEPATIPQPLVGQYNPAANFGTSRFNADFGGRNEVHDRDTYRIVAGIEGDFNDDWHYELAVNYGRLETYYEAGNNLMFADIDGNLDGFALAINPILAPANFGGTNFVTNQFGQRVICAINATTNVRPDCVPLNTFGTNKSDPRAIAFSHTTSSRTEWAEEFVASAFVRGDLSQLFELPGGPVQFALGAEYRTEKAYSDFDDLTQSGATFLNAIPTFAPPKFAVKEAYGEIRIPLLKDVPFFNLLAVEGAARVSDYNSAVGTVWAYNLSGIWAPIPDIRFRANYSTSVRAPTQTDLYSAPGQNFAFIADPCDALSISGNPNRAANCVAYGLPSAGGIPINNAANTAICANTSFAAPTGAPFVNCTARASSVGFSSGGNGNLVQEEGKSYTIGAILTPRFIPGLSVTVDYYNIEVKNLIAALTAQTILNLCFDSPGGVNNPYCALTFARTSSGLFNNPAVFSGGVNFASQKTEGVDVDLAYNHRFANGHRLSVRAIGTHLIALNNFTDPRPGFENLPNRQKSEIGDPEWAGNATATYDFGPVAVTYGVQYLGKMTIAAYEGQNSYQGACPTNGQIPGGGTCTPNSIVTLPPQNADSHPFVWYPDVFYHNIRLRFDVDDFQFYMGMDNVTNELPPYGLDGTGGTGFSTSGGAIYGHVGRFFYAGFNVDF
jgi:outer membrane receptor protein involved in Fe transport